MANRCQTFGSHGMVLILNDIWGCRVQISPIETVLMYMMPEQETNFNKGVLHKVVVNASKICLEIGMTFEVLQNELNLVQLHDDTLKPSSTYDVANTTRSSVS